jgi:uncharacterized protein YukE
VSLPPAVVLELPPGNPDELEHVAAGLERAGREVDAAGAGLAAVPQRWQGSWEGAAALAATTAVHRIAAGAGAAAAGLETASMQVRRWALELRAARDEVRRWQREADDLHADAARRIDVLQRTPDPAAVAREQMRLHAELRRLVRAADQRGQRLAEVALAVGRVLERTGPPAPTGREDAVRRDVLAAMAGRPAPRPTGPRELDVGHYPALLRELTARTPRARP